MAADAEPDTTVREAICFLCKDPCLSRDKIKVFGRSSLEISALIARATKVDLSVYVASDREKAVICNSCYKRLVKYQNVLRKLDAVVGEIQRNFRGRGLSRGKRLVSAQNRPLHANNKRIKLEDLLASSSASPRETLHQAPSTCPSTLQLNSYTEATVHVVYASPNSINTASNAGSSVSTFARPSPILAADNTATKPGISGAFARPPLLAFANGVNTAIRPGICLTTAFTRPPPISATATQPGISLTTFGRPSPVLATTNNVNTAVQPGVFLSTFTRPFPVLAAGDSVSTASKPGISVATWDRPPISAIANSVKTATKPGISVTTLDRPSISTAANSVNTATKPGISVTTLNRPPISTAANSVNTATKPGISVTTLDKPPISTAASSVNTATKPGISVTTLDRPPISTAANSVSTATKHGISLTILDRPPISTAANGGNTTTKPGISVTTLDRPFPISTAANSVNTASKPGISVTTLDRPPLPSTTNSVNTTTKPVTSVFFPDPLVSFTADQLFAALPLQAQKPEQKQEIRIRICVDYPSKPVRKELKSDLHVLAKAMVDGNHQRIAGAALKIDGVKELVIEKVIKLMTLQVDELCSKHRPSMLRTTSRNTNDEAKNFDYKKVCSEWKERAPIFHAFLIACAAIKNSKKKNSPECLPGVAVAGTVLLKQRNTQMNAGFAKILGFLIKSKSLEVRSCFLPLFCIFLIGKNGTMALQMKCLCICLFCVPFGGGTLFCSIPIG